MNLYGVIIVLLIITFLTMLGINSNNVIVYGQSIETATDTNFKNYLNPSAISIQYPITWLVKDLPNVDGVLFYPGSADVGIIVQNQIVTEPTLELKYGSLINQLPLNLKDSQIDSYQSVKNNQTLFQDGILTFGQPPNENKLYQMRYLDKDILKIFTFFGSSELFEKYSGIAQKMQESYVTMPERTNSLLESMNSNLKTNLTYKSANKDFENSINKIPSQKNESDFEIKNITFKNYESLSKMINFSYPNFLNLLDNENGVYLTNDNGTAGFFIDIKPLGFSDLADFSNLQINYLKNNFANFSILNSTQKLLLEKPTQMVYFSYTNNTTLYTGLQMIFTTSAKGFVLTFFSPSDEFDRYLPFIINMISSLKVDSK